MIASVSEDEDSTFRKRSQSSATTQNSSRRLRTLTEPTAEVNTIVPQNNNNNNEDEDDSGSNLIDPFQNPNYQKSSPTTPHEDNNNNNELLLITPPTKSTTVPRTTVDVSNFQLNLDSAVKINETQNELSSLSPQSQKTNVPLTSRIRLPTFFRNKFKKTVMNEGEVFDKEELKKLVGEFSNISEYSKKNSEITLQDFTKCLGRLKEHSQQLDNNNTNSNNNSNNSNTNNNDSNFLAKMIFQAVDSDNNGKLDFKEFLSVMSVLVKGTTEEKLDFAFTMIDRDKDGKISREEWITVITTLYKVIESLGLSSSYLYNKLHSPIDYANELFNEMDTENLNYLTLQNYKDAAMRLTDKFVGLGIVNETQPIIQENDNNNNNNNNTTNNNGYFQLLPEENFSPTPKNKPLGKLITFGSKRWQLVLNIMLGIRLSIDATGTIERNVRAEDFHVRILFDLLKESNNNLNDWLYLSNNNITYIPPPLKNSEEEENAIDVTFVDYAPFVFKHIRHLSGVSEKSYMMSLGPEQILGNLLLGNLSTLSERITDGKSGSLFFYSSDQRFLVKTITKYEVTCLKRILPYYYHHLKTNPDSLITRILGFYEMTVNKESDKVFFIVMANIFPNTKVLSELYDLKGSTHNRTNPDGFCKKDLDLIEKQRKFKIGAVNHLYYLSILEKDIEFLSKCNVLDYSLLVGVHKVKTGTIILNSVGASATSSVFTMSNAAMEKSTVTSDMITNDNNNNNILNNTSSSVVSGSVTSTGFLSEIETTVSISLNEGDENILLSTPPTTATTILNNSINNNNTNNNNNSNSSSSTISNNSSWERKRSGSVSTLKYSRFTRNNKCVCAIPSSILDEMTDEPQEIYYIGIIDILTEFNFKKEAEYNLNIMTGKGESSSAIPPKPYSNRFLKFMYKCFE